LPVQKGTIQPPDQAIQSHKAAIQPVEPPYPIDFADNYCLP
jgi:hypothetical protein